MPLAALLLEAPPTNPDPLQRAIHADVLLHSPHIREPNFKTAAALDLRYLFRQYDDRFFGGECGVALGGRKLTFRLAPRMTKVGGTTTAIRHRDGTLQFEIAIAISTLFDGFGPSDPIVSVCGLPCQDRLEALQRIFEHELMHLCERLVWDASDCSAERFQSLAQRWFGHRSHTHQLITRRQRAALAGIVRGSRVSFTFEGQRLTGRVNRVTKRATVLVENAAGELFSDGRRYLAFYVPLSALQLENASEAVAQREAEV